MNVVASQALPLGRRVVLMLLVVLVAAAGCATTGPPPATVGELVSEYASDRDVVNDVLRNQPDGSPEDRLANIASYFDEARLAIFLFGEGPCGERVRIVGISLVEREQGCPIPAAVADGVPGAEVTVRYLLVRHDDARLELVPLYVARSGTDAVLVDSGGRVYRGGLDDFRANNPILSTTDQMAVAADPTDADSREFIVVSGSTAAPIGTIVVIAVGGLLLLLVVIVVWRRRRNVAP